MHASCPAQNELFCCGAVVSRATEQDQPQKPQIIKLHNIACKSSVDTAIQLTINKRKVATNIEQVPNESYFYIENHLLHFRQIQN